MRKITLPYWIRRHLREWPLVWRTTHLRACASARVAGRDDAHLDLSRERDQLTRILDRLVGTQYRRMERTYQMTVRFDPILFTRGSCDRDEQWYLARHIASRVEGEIATSKFIKDADEREMAEGPRHGRMRP